MSKRNLNRRYRKTFIQPYTIWELRYTKLSALSDALSRIRKNVEH
jgi:hypothetical protein